jgi:hypothetical protein
MKMYQQRSRGQLGQKNTGWLFLGDSKPLVIELLLKNATFHPQYFYDIIIIMLVHRLLSQGPVTTRYHWMNHRDNAYSHGSNSSTASIAGQKLTRLSHPPYSLDIAFSDFYLFGNIKTWLRECHRTMFKELQLDVIEVLSSLSEDGLFRIFCESKKLFEHVITINGEYV